MPEPIVNLAQLPACNRHVRFTLRNLDVIDGADITVADVRRAYGMIAAHNTTTAVIWATILMLDRPVN